MGSPEFALPSLHALTGVYELVGIVTQPDRPSGRGREIKSPPVKDLALELGLPFIQPERINRMKAMDQLRLWSPELIVVAAFGQILKRELLNLPHYGCINVHASLLPRWRGAAPIQAAILQGDEETGVTIMKMDEGLDTGPILNQRSVCLNRDDTANTVTEKLSQLGANLLIETLPDYLSGKIHPLPQPREGMTYAPLIKKTDARLDFSHPADDLARRVRAFNPWPGAYMDFEGGPLKIHHAHGERIHSNQQKPGTRTVHNGLPAVFSADGLIIFEEMQPAGKKSMTGKSFLAGARNWVASTRSLS
jgi:methionyl-tRNA formyltransferase